MRSVRWTVCVLLVSWSLTGCQAAEPVGGGASAEAEVAQGEMAASLELLDAFAQAWNRHDADALMSMMTDDCIYEASGGDEVVGRRYEGQEAVRAAFEAIFEAFPDAQWRDAKHFASGDRGLSEWTFTGTAADGSRVEVNGCDVFTLRDGKIWLKNSLRKIRPALPPE